MSPPVGRLLDLTGRAALVTGAGAGIGRSIARRFAEAGATLLVHYRSSEAGAREVVEAIREDGGEATPLQAELREPGEVERLFEEALAAAGRLDILVNNAGIYPLAPLEEIDAEEWDRVLGANLGATHLCTRAAARRMEAGGAVVNVASIEGLQPMPDHAHYDAAKAGVLMHTRAAALELGPRGIRVNAVSPGLIDTGALEETWPEGLARWREATPLGRAGEPLDVADACLVLASDAARWITGANLVVDGGATSRPAF